MKKGNWYKLLYAAGGLLALGFLIRVGADLYQYNEAAHSAPFYVFLLLRGVEFLLPSALFLIAALVLKKKLSK